MTSEQILLKIDGLQEQVEGLRKEYYSIAPSCRRKECVFHQEKLSRTGKCSWSHQITRCENYIPE